MGLETPAEYGGAECSFMAAILAVEGMCVMFVKHVNT